jgi:hypothetical protein
MKKFQVVHVQLKMSFSKRIITDETFHKLFHEEEEFMIPQVRLSKAIEQCQLSDQHTTLDFSDNCIRKVTPFFHIRNLSKCTLLNLANNEISEDQWKHIRILLQLMPNGSIRLTNNPILWDDEEVFLRLEQAEPELFARLILH